MKKSLLIIGAAVVLFSSCKKKGTNEFEAKDTTGYATLSGAMTKNVGGLITPAAGVAVEVRVNNYGAGGLYPNVTTGGTYGSEVYYATSDAMGKYSVSVKTNGAGVTANVLFKGWQTTLDTAAASKVYDFPGFTATPTIIKGVDVVINIPFVGTVLTQPTQTMNGTATVKGKIMKGMAIHSFSVGATTTTNVPVGAGVTVYCEYDLDPLTLTKRIYTTTTDANGMYSFSAIRTPNTLGLGGSLNSAKVWVADMASTYDTIRFNGTISAGTKPGVYGTANTTQNNVKSMDIRNAVNLTFGAHVND